MRAPAMLPAPTNPILLSFMARLRPPAPRAEADFPQCDRVSRGPPPPFPPPADRERCLRDATEVEPDAPRKGRCAAQRARPLRAPRLVPGAVADTGWRASPCRAGAGRRAVRADAVAAEKGGPP